ncbi:MAG: hypothetical protein LBU25_10165 [Treponema sp.]|jgi:hypothetical protein|nr:hypothetical protein [Treponema sp.]
MAENPLQETERKLWKGLAGLMIEWDAKDLSDELGLYGLEQSGDTVRLASGLNGSRPGNGKTGHYGFRQALPAPPKRETPEGVP